MPLSYDVDVAAHKYLAGLEDGEVPLLLLFSGTVFTGRGRIDRRPAGAVAQGGRDAAAGHGVA